MTTDSDPQRRYFTEDGTEIDREAMEGLLALGLVSLREHADGSVTVAMTPEGARELGAHEAAS